MSSTGTSRQVPNPTFWLCIQFKGRKGQSTYSNSSFIGMFPALCVENIDSAYKGKIYLDKPGKKSAGCFYNAVDHFLHAGHVKHTKALAINFLAPGWQAYLAKNLRRCPHGIVPKEFVQLLVNKAMKCGVPVEFYNPDQSYLDPSQTLQVINSGKYQWLF